MENNPAFLQVKDKKNLVASRLYQEGFSTGLLKKLAQELQVSLRTIRRWAKAVNGNNVESENKRVKKPNSLEITQTKPAFQFLLEEAQKIRLADRNISVANIILTLESEYPEYNGILKRSTLQKYLKKTHYSSSELRLSANTHGRKGYGRFHKKHRMESVQCDIKEFPKDCCIDNNGNPCTPYVQICIDNYSRKILSYNIDTEQKTSIVVRSLQDMILTYGLPASLHMDNGAQYKNRVIETAAQILSIDLVYCRPRSGASKGVVERYNGTLNAIENQLLNGNKTIKFSAFKDAISQFIDHHNQSKTLSGLDGKSPNEIFDADTQTSLKIPPKSLVISAFQRSFTRKIQKDRTISYEGNKYEVILDSTSFVGGHASLIIDSDGKLNQVLADNTMVRIYPQDIGENIKEDHRKIELPIPDSNCSLRFMISLLRENERTLGMYTTEEEFQAKVRSIIKDKMEKEEKKEEKKQNNKAKRGAISSPYTKLLEALTEKK